MPPNVRFRLVATSDLHANVLGWDYHSDTPKVGLGLLPLAPLIDDARAEVPGALLLDNGDFLQGSPLGDWAADAAPAGPHPMIEAMNRLAYDAANIGNHEFGHGLPMLRRAMAEARFPILSSNLSLRGGPTFRRAAMVTRSLPGIDHPIRIGITGIAPPQTAVWESRNLRGRLVAKDAVQAATTSTRRLRRAGADIVILLAHTGLGAAERIPMMENAAIPLSRLSGADILILGHTHGLYPDGRELLARPAVMPGCFGSHLGCIDLDLETDGRSWSIRAHRARLLRPPDSAPPSRLTATVLPMHVATRSWLRTPVGTAQQPLRSHFARLVPTEVNHLVAAAQAEHVRRRLDPQQIDGRPILSATAAFRCGGRSLAEDCTDIPAGVLTLRNLADVYPHPNTVVALALSGAEVADWLERAAHQFHQITKGSRDAPLIDPDSPAFDFDLIQGLSFGIDLSAPRRFDARGSLIDPAARRITRLRLQGQPIHPADRFILATNSYRAAGSGGFPACRDDRVLLDDGTTSRAALAAFIASGKVWPVPKDVWAIDPLPGTTALFDAPPGADRHIASLARFRPEALPAREASPLCRFRLHL